MKSPNGFIPLVVWSLLFIAATCPDLRISNYTFIPVFVSDTNYPGIVGYTSGK